MRRGPRISRRDMWTRRRHSLCAWQRVGAESRRRRPRILVAYASGYPYRRAGHIVFGRFPPGPVHSWTRYDYEFLYLLAERIRDLRKMAKSGKGIVCHTVLDEIDLHVICEYAQFDLAEYAPTEEADPMETFAEIAGDCDIDMWLFCRDSLVALGDNYHFDCWNEPQFFLEPPIEK